MDPTACVPESVPSRLQTTDPRYRQKHDQEGHEAAQVVRTEDVTPQQHVVRCAP